ncbi:MAG: hypothetical protein JW705_09670 [Methanosarcinaceae archaeon]|nr:hypothetical protein [Methanosarcinaceae archaeon]
MKQLFLKLTMVLVVLVCLCFHAGARSTTDDDIDWLGAEEFTLYWGEEVNASGYIITAEDFSPSRPSDVDTDYVMLSVVSEFSDSWGTVLALNNSDISDHYVFEDQLNITALEIITGNDIPAPYTTISVAIANQSVPFTTVVKKIDATIDVQERITDEIYMDERAHVEFRIENLRDTVLESVELVTPIPKEFILDPDVTLQRNFSIPAFGQRTISYSLKALRPGTYNFSGAQVLVGLGGRTYAKTLNDSLVTVHGPFIDLTKTVSADSVEIGTVIDVDIVVENEGDRAAYVSVCDEIPLGAVLLSGDTCETKVLHPSDRMNLTYSMQMDLAGSIVIPSVKAKFVDSKEYEGTVYSRRSLVHVSDPSRSIEDDLTVEGPVIPSGDSLFHTNVSGEGFYDGDGPLGTEPDEDHGIFQFAYDLLNLIKVLLADIK